jgi:2,3-bisphosphoglycerate-independent phosphoglycerate mutase
MKKTHALIILDGFGLNASEYGNAVKLAKTPNFDYLKNKYPYTTVKAHGENVGLYKGQMGNSEVGHLNLGAGRVVLQDSKKISDLIKSGEFFKNQTLKNVFDTRGAVHLMGLLSSGGVHSEFKHITALIDMAKKQGKKEVFLHLFTDGRDCDPEYSIVLIKKLQAHLNKVGVGKIASAVGRFFAMDRDKNYNRTKLAYDMLVLGKAKTETTNLISAIKQSHKKGITDEFLEPIIVLNDDEPTTIKDGDSVIFYNFRGDRARQLTTALTSKEFSELETKNLKINFVGLTEYDVNLKNAKTAFFRQNMKNTLGEVLAKESKTQLRIAETTKYAHVTYFFNGGVEKPNEGEDRILVPTKDVKTFDLLPEMSAKEIVEQVKLAVVENKYDFVLINFANCDMVGHTGDLKAAIRAVEVVDEALGEVFEHFNKMGASVLITADHGNAENMLTKEGKPHTAHTTNLVPLILADDEKINFKLKKGGKLSDITATVLHLMNIKAPKEFEAISLIKNN